MFPLCLSQGSLQGSLVLAASCKCRVSMRHPQLSSRSQHQRDLKPFAYAMGPRPPDTTAKPPSHKDHRVLASRDLHSMEKVQSMRPIGTRLSSSDGSQADLTTEHCPLMHGLFSCTLFFSSVLSEPVDNDGAGRAFRALSLSLSLHSICASELPDRTKELEARLCLCSF